MKEFDLSASKSIFKYQGRYTSNKIQKINDTLTLASTSSDYLSTECLKGCAGGAYMSCSYCGNSLSCWESCTDSSECISKCPGLI
ncbi:MAG: hypothetical protein Q8942_15435 [Bacillota bacterium]|nr:hypothetical protein [Bacillota bacterium]